MISSPLTGKYGRFPGTSPLRGKTLTRLSSVRLGGYTGEKKEMTNKGLKKFMIKDEYNRRRSKSNCKQDRSYLKCLPRETFIIGGTHVDSNKYETK